MQDSRQDPTGRERGRQALRGRLLDPELLRSFAAVVECGGYTAAARHLHRTQAAISQQIRRLEEAVGSPLFDGPKRQHRLTVQGELLLEHAWRLLALNHELLERLRPGSVRGVVRMGVTNFYATHVLPPLLRDFAQLYPEVHIDLEVGTADRMRRDLGTVFDLTINSFESGQGRGLLLRRDPGVWVVSRSRPPRVMDPVPLALLPPGSLLRRWAEAALTGAGRPWVVVQESSNIEVLKAAVLAGTAAGVFQRATVRALRTLRRLTPAEGFPRLPSAEMRLVCAERDVSPAARCLHDYLVQHLPPWEARPSVSDEVPQTTRP